MAGLRKARKTRRAGYEERRGLRADGFPGSSLSPLEIAKARFPHSHRPDDDDDFFLGDISIELSMGTLLSSLDTESSRRCSPAEDRLP